MWRVIGPDLLANQRVWVDDCVLETSVWAFSVIMLEVFADQMAEAVVPRGM